MSEETAQTQEFNVALKRVVKTANYRNLLAKGLREVAKTIESKKAKFCILAEDCDNEDYQKLVKALCKVNNVHLLTLPAGETIGEWIGICKYDSQKNIRKRRKCSSLVVKDYAIEVTPEEKKVIEDKLAK